MSWSEKLGEALAGLGFIMIVGVIVFCWAATPT